MKENNCDCWRESPKLLEKKESKVYWIRPLVLHQRLPSTLRMGQDKSRIASAAKISLADPTVSLIDFPLKLVRISNPRTRWGQAFNNVWISTKRQKLLKSRRIVQTRRIWSHHEGIKSNWVINHKIIKPMRLILFLGQLLHGLSHILTITHLGVMSVCIYM